jgi:hypothetical protein
MLFFAGRSLEYQVHKRNRSSFQECFSTVNRLRDAITFANTSAPLTVVSNLWLESIAMVPRVSCASSRVLVQDPEGIPLLC